MRGAVAAQFAGVFERYVDEVFSHMWAEPKKMDDPDVVGAALTESGFDAAALLARTQEAEVKDRLLKNTQEFGRARHFRHARLSSWATKFFSARIGCAMLKKRSSRTK